MSWQAYIDSSLLGTGKVDKAAIYSKPGDSTWAASKGFNLSQEEIKTIAGGFDNSSALQEKGVRLQGEKYFLTSADEKTITGRKGEEGVIAVRTKQAIIVAHYPAGQQAGDVNKVVGTLGDYLVEQGY